MIFPHEGFVLFLLVQRMETQELHKLLFVTVSNRNPLPADDDAHALYFLHLSDVDDPGAVYLQETGRQLLLYLGHRGACNDRFPPLGVYLRVVPHSLYVQDVGNADIDVLVSVLDQQVVFPGYRLPCRREACLFQQPARRPLEAGEIEGLQQVVHGGEAVALRRVFRVGGSEDHHRRVGQ